MGDYLSPDILPGAVQSVYTPSLNTSIVDYVPQMASVVSQNAQGGESWTDTLTRLLPQLALANNQRQLLDIQLQRAKAGQPPLDMSNFGLGVNVGVSPDIKNLLIIGVIGLVAVVYLTRKKA